MYLKAFGEESCQNLCFKSKETLSAEWLLLLTLSQHFNGFMRYDFPLQKLYLFTPLLPILFIIDFTSLDPNNIRIWSSEVSLI